MEYQNNFSSNNTQINSVNKLKPSPLWKIVALIMALLTLIISTLIYSWQHRQLETAKNSLNTTNQALDSANQKINDFIAKEKLYTLPDKSSFSPQCETTNNDGLIISSITPQPISGFQAYIINCANNPSIPARITAFKVQDDGSRSFAFGAGTGEPLCISNKIIDSSAANEISNKTRIPICNTF